MSSSTGGLHHVGCRSKDCRGCVPTKVSMSPLIPARPVPVPRLPEPLAPAAKALLMAFYEWLDRQPGETLSDDSWTPERLVDLFILEATNAVR